MHDIWNPWHGCKKCSEGCENCYMYFLDAQRGRNGADIYRTKVGFKYPLSKDRSGHYKVKSGEYINIGFVTADEDKTGDMYTRLTDALWFTRFLRTYE